MVGYIRGTTTATGLVVSASIDRGTYPTKVKVSDQEMSALMIRRHEVCPRWNYTITPRRLTTVN